MKKYNDNRHYHIAESFVNYPPCRYSQKQRPFKGYIKSISSSAIALLLMLFII